MIIRPARSVIVAPTRSAPSGDGLPWDAPASAPEEKIEESGLPSTGLLGWWELRDATGEAGVTGLADKSAAGNDLTAEGTGDEITLLTDLSYGGVKVGVFSGGKYLHLAELTGGSTAQPVTICVLGEVTSGDGALAGGADATGEGPFGVVRFDGNVGLTQASTLAGSEALADSTPVALLGIFNGATTSLRAGSDWSTANEGEVGTDALAGVTIGGLADGTLPLTGKVALVAWWDHALDADEIAQVAAYLNSDFGQTVTP